MCDCKRRAGKRSLCKGILWSVVNSFEKGGKKRTDSGFPLGLENMENEKAFSNQRKVREFLTDWKRQ